MWLAFIAIALVASTTGKEKDLPTCNKFACKDKEQEKCVTKKGTDITLFNCKKGTVCPIIEDIKTVADVKCAKAKDDKKKEEDCAKPKAEGKECKKDSECGAGFTCKTKDKKDKKTYCAKAAAEKEACTQHTDCGVGLGCIAKKCTKYNSIKAGGLSSHGVLCESGAVDKDSKCLKPLEDEQNNKADSCTKDSECSKIITITKNENPEEGKCRCGINKAGKRFCPPDSRYSVVNDYYKAKFDNLAYSKKYYLSKIVNWAKLQDNDECFAGRFAVLEAHKKAQEQMEKCGASFLALALSVLYFFF